MNPSHSAIAGRAEHRKPDGYCEAVAILEFPG